MRELLEAATAALRPSRTAPLDAQLLLGHLMGRDRAWVLAHGGERVAPDTTGRYRDIVARRASGEPVAYLRGHVEWFGLNLTVNPAVLIPRPDTEILVERGIGLCRRLGATKAADIGTGSGAIALALVHELPDLRVTGVDVSAHALEVAAANAAALGLEDRVAWLTGNLAEPLTACPDILVANLPYLSWSMMEDLDADVRYEPGSALYGGETGLELYDQLLTQLDDRGWFPPLLLEFDPRQSAALRALVNRHWPEASVQLWRDLAGHDRVAEVTAAGGQR